MLSLMSIRYRGLLDAIRRTQGRFSPDPDAVRVLTAQAALSARRSQPVTYRHLFDAELRVFSQWGEDGILDLLCDALALHKPRVVEIGAGNFEECNSRFLAENRSASVVAIDAREDLTATIRSSPLMWKTHLYAIQTWVMPSNAVQVFEESKRLLGGATPEILSLDLDGIDYWILDQLDLRGVRVVVVEYNPLLGAERAVSVPRAENFDRSEQHYTRLYFGASLKAWIHLLGQKNFVLVGSNRQGNNAFFVDAISADRVPVVPVDTTDLSPFVQWNVRESRDSSGELSYLSHHERISAMSDMPVIDVVTGEVLTIRDLYASELP
jgi:hypothetical protein